MRFLAKTLLVVACLSCAPAIAQEAPPARVGRVSFISGALAFYQSADTDWSAAQVGFPAATGDWFATDPQSRAELRVGPDTIDIAEDSQLDIADLRDRVMQIGLEHGRVNLHLRQLRKDASAEIDTSRGAVSLLQPGIYDIDTGAADRPARIMVLDGSARFVGGSVDLAVKAGDAAVLSGTDIVSATIERAGDDAFGKWCRSRDYHQDRLTAPYHVSPAMTGFEELDAYGSWGAAQDYGAVWYPNSLPADWAPYRTGRWIWVEPWGWNWVDAEPWGFAPFHYGRWARINDRWGWVPGEFVPQPVYAPALVAFVEEPGIAAPVAVAGGPALGWFPLAPGEVYWPSYTRDPTYIENINIANVGATKITNIAAAVKSQHAVDPPPPVLNQQFANRGAATVVPANVFARSEPVAAAALPVQSQVLHAAAVSVRPPQLPPAVAERAPGPSSTPEAVPPQATREPPTPTTPGAPGHRPSQPNFSRLATAPAPTTVRQAAPTPSVPGLSPGHQQPVQTTTATQPSGQPPAPPNFSRLPPAMGAHGQPPVAPPAQAAQGTPPPAGASGPSEGAQHPTQAPAAAPAPGRPPIPPNFSHLAPAKGTPGQPAITQPPVQPGPGTPPATGHVPARPSVTQAPPPHPEASPHGVQQANQRASEQQQSAAQQQAQQRAAQAAAQQQAQQRATQAAAQQQAQQRAAQAAAQQQAQQRAAQAAAQQQAQQRAAAVKQAQAHAPSCGNPGQPACPR